MACGRAWRPAHTAGIRGGRPPHLRSLREIENLQKTLVVGQTRWDGMEMTYAYDASKLTIEEAVREFSRAQEQPFTIEDAVDRLSPLLRAAPANPDHAFAQVLEACGLFFNEPESGQYISRHRFFQDAAFLVVPLAHEIERGILIPGHRFLPFSSPDIFPSQCRLMADGNTMTSKTVVSPLKNLFMFLSLLGRRGLIEYLLTDCPDNRCLLQNGVDESALFRVTVFDMASLYPRLAFREGDAFQLAVRDWSQGIFDVHHVKAAEIASRQLRAKAWHAEWRENLLDALEELADTGRTLEAGEQIARALFLGSEALRREPVSSMGGLLGEERMLFEDVPSTGTSVLRPADVSIDELVGLPGGDWSQPAGRCDSLEAILDECHIEDGATLVEAAIREQLASGKCDAHAVIARADGGKCPPFHDERQESICLALVEDLRRRVESHGRGSASAACDPMRTRILDALAKGTQAMRQADAAGLSMDDQDLRATIVASAEVRVVLLAWLAVANEAAGEPMPKDAFSQAESALKELADATDHIERLVADEQELAAQEEAEAEAAKHRRRAALGAPAVYRLKVTLRHTDPPVWRRVEVANDMTLGDLHVVLQVVMGWDDDHAHGFSAKKRRFLPSEALEHDWGEAEDEDDVQLREVATQARSKLVYTYDFGDDWKHDVVVEKVLPLDDRALYPRYVNGERAAPPEDCGGIWGYQRLVQGESADADEEPIYPDFRPEHVPEAVIHAQLNRLRGR